MERTKFTGGQGGFTLIELIMVIVILGILAAVAVPKFIDLSEEASRAAVKGVAGGLSSASAINYATDKVDDTKAETVGSCEDVGPLLVGGLPADYTIVEIDNTTAVGGDHTIWTCRVRNKTESDYSATFQAIAVE